MPSLRAGGIELAHEVQGDGTAVLLVHGTPSSMSLYAEAAEVLARRARCIRYERRGFPRSRPAGPSDVLDLSDHLDDAVALLEALAAVPAVVIGRSTGGQIALALALRRPDVVRALVLLEPAVFTVDPQAEAWATELRRNVLRAAAREPSRAAEHVLRAALGDDTWESLPADVRRLFDAAAPAVLAEMRGVGLDLSAEPLRPDDRQLATVTRPTLVVSGSGSPEPLRRVAERLAGALPAAEHVTVPGGHLVDPAGPAVLSFLDRVLLREGAAG